MPELTALEQQLSRLGGDLEWPATPNLAPAIVSRIRARQDRPRPWFESRWAMAAAVAILVLAALLAYPPSREAISNWVNVHTRWVQVTQLPTPTPQPPGPLGERLGLGGKTTLARAEGAVTWHVLVPTNLLSPANLGQPDEVYLQLPTLGPPEGEITLVFKGRPGIPTSAQTGVGVLITEARGAVNRDFFGKMLGPGTTVEAVTVTGHQGYWISGRPHDLVLIDADGNMRGETLRLATNTLLLDVGGAIVRIEGELTKAQALEIAASLA